MSRFPELCVRPVSIHDAGALQDFFAELASQASRSWPAHPTVPAHARHLCTCDDTVASCEIACLGPELVGCAVVGWQFREKTLARLRLAGAPPDPAADALVSLHVADAWQGMGLAHLLVQRAAVLARQRRRTRLVLAGGLPADAPNLIGLYEALGFRTVGRDPAGARTVEMVLDLDAQAPGQALHPPPPREPRHRPVGIR